MGIFLTSIIVMGILGIYPNNNFNEGSFPQTLNPKRELETRYQDQNIIREQPSKSVTMSGAQKFAVICARFADVPNTRWTITEIEDIMETLNDFWYNASYANSLGSLGSVTIDFQVEGWYDLPNNQNAYSPLYDDDPAIADFWDDVIDDAIALADSDFNFANFDYILVWINGNWWRGISTIGKGYQIITDEGTFNVAASLVGENSVDPVSTVWGRVAHEMGHSFGLRHTHQDYNSWFSLMARAYPSDLTVYSQEYSATDWFDETNNEEVFYPGDSEAEFVVRPRSVDISGDIQSLKVVITFSSYWGYKIPKTYYIVEVINQSSEDAWLSDEGVHIYLVDPSPGVEPLTDMDANPATASVADCLFDAGQTFSDTANSITIEVVELVGNDGYRIKINNNAGPIDLMINPWGSTGSIRAWETPDIWVDSPMNGWDFTRYRDSGNPSGRWTSGIPIGIGDDPWNEHENRLYARIHNVGGVKVTNAKVSFYAIVPSGIGNSGWQFIDDTTVTLDPGTSEEVFVTWTPEIDLCTCQTGLVNVHGCVKVIIEEIPGELNIGNNVAQENIDYYEITKPTGANWGLFCVCFLVINAFPIERDFYFNFFDFSWSWENESGWSHENQSDFGKFYHFKGDEQMEFMLPMNILPGTQFGTTLEADIVISEVTSKESADPEFIGDIFMELIGGISILGMTMYRSSLTISTEIIENGVKVEGTLTPLDGFPAELFPDVGEDRKILLEISKGSSIIDTVVEMDDFGKFDHIFNTTDPSGYTVKAFYAGSEILASSRWPVTEDKDTPTMRFSISITAILFLAVLVAHRKRRKT